MLHNIISPAEVPLPNDICSKISSYVKMELFYFPQEVLEHILTFVPYNLKYNLSKRFYNKYHSRVNFHPYEGYMRHIIRNDHDYVLKSHLNSSFGKWKQKKKIIYKKVKYDSFLSLLNSWCISYKSNKCREVISMW